MCSYCGIAEIGSSSVHPCTVYAYIVAVCDIVSPWLPGVVDPEVSLSTSEVERCRGHECGDRSDCYCYCFSGYSAISIRGVEVPDICSNIAAIGLPDVFTCC